MKAIEVKALRMVYSTGVIGGRKVALDGLDLDVKEGEIFGYLGPNGAGKTTTIKILVGITRARSGVAKVFGKAAGSADVRRLTGFLPEEPYFYEHLRAEEALRFYARLDGLSGQESRRRAGEVLEEVGLGGEGKRRLGEFSRGMRQRFGFAQAIVHRPRLVFLDEPLSGLDPLGRRDIRELIVDLSEKGTTVFFSSHILPDVEMICNRVGIIDRGKLQAVGSLEELLPEETKYVEVTAEGLKGEGLSQLEELSSAVRKEGRMVRARIEDEGDVEKAINIIREAGGKVKAIVPQRMTLEEAFMRTSSEGREGQEGGTRESPPSSD